MIMPWAFFSLNRATAARYHGIKKACSNMNLPLIACERKKICYTKYPKMVENTTLSHFNILKATDFESAVRMTNSK